MDRWPSLKGVFEHHFDGVRLDKLISQDEPEKILWLHLEHMRINMDMIVEKQSYRKLMTFDESSRVETFPEFPQWKIDAHLQRHENKDEGFS